MTEIESLLYGPSPISHMVACEKMEDDGFFEIFIEEPESGKVSSKFVRVPFFLITSEPKSSGWHRLKGNLPLNYLKTYETKKALWQDKRFHGNVNLFHISDDKESALSISGATFFRDLHPYDVSVLSFDIESTGISHDENSKVLLISNTYQRRGNKVTKLFAYDEFESEGEMLLAWCKWVREMNPSVIVGHNIYSYDLPYLAYCAGKAGVTLELGRNGSVIRFNNYESKFRRDGTQFYTYHAAHIYGRSIVDTFFLSFKYDVGRKYESYGLKNIIKQEGLERDDREHYDASLIRHNYKNADEWQKIKRYSEHDADDSLALYNLMIPSFFYLSQMIPKPFQNIITGASGSQINSLLIRSYIQESHSMPLPDEACAYEGAISIGNPGLYENVFKVDVASLYPSIMLEYKIYDKEKDPLCHLLKMLSYLTKVRLDNKRLAKETGERHYKDLESSQKIIINSIYGLLGAPGIHFNSPKNAALITKHGREILTKALEWAQAKGYVIVNADTDSISVCNKDFAPIDPDSFLAELNSLYPERIRWENDGTYKSFLVLKSKNYVLDSAKKGRTVKGSALKATLKEPAFREFINDVISCIISRDLDAINGIYKNYVKEILSIKDIRRFSSKKTITESVLSPSRTNEQKVFDAIQGSDYSQGDKMYVYFRIDGSLALSQNWNPNAPDHDIEKLLEKLYKTLLVFDSALEVKNFPNFKLKKNKPLLRQII